MFEQLICTYLPKLMLVERTTVSQKVIEIPIFKTIYPQKETLLKTYFCQKNSLTK